MHRLHLGSLALPAALLAGCLHLNGQEQPADRPEREYTEDQEKAIDRVDQLAERLQGMPWTPAVISALSRLGNVACQHDKALGIRVFERAYSVAAGIDFDLNEESSLHPESSLHLLSTLASRAMTCHPDFVHQSLTRSGDSSRLNAQASLYATLDAVRTDPSAAGGFAMSVAESLSDLDAQGKHLFAKALISLRQQQPSATDAVFQHVLRKVVASGSVPDLFALGNYIFGPTKEEGIGSQGILVSSVPGGRIYAFSEARPGVPSELASVYIASASEIFAGKGASEDENAVAFALTKQLESWARSNAPEQTPILKSLLSEQRARMAQDEGQSALEDRLQRISRPFFGSAEERFESAPDEATKAGLRFYLVALRIKTGDLEGARELVADLEEELQQPILDIIALAEVSKTISGGDLEAARLGLSTLNDKLHLVLASLNLASALWSLSDESGNRLDEDVQSAAEAIQLAGILTAKIPEDLRPKIRLAIAEGLALTERVEESLVALELAVQEFNVAKVPKDRPDDIVSVRVTDNGGVSATVTRGERPGVFNLLPPRKQIANFPAAVLRLSTSPEPDFDRLEGIVASVVDPRMRTSGLLALAEGALANAFGPAREPLTESRDRDEPSQDSPTPPATEEQEPPD